MELTLKTLWTQCDVRKWLVVAVILRHRLNIILELPAEHKILLPLFAGFPSYHTVAQFIDVKCRQHLDMGLSQYLINVVGPLNLGLITYLFDFEHLVQSIDISSLAFVCHHQTGTHGKGFSRIQLL